MSKAEYWQRGEVIDFTNSTETKIDANEIVVFGKRLGVAGTPIEPGETGSLHVFGVFEMPKSSTEAIPEGTSVYFDGNGITEAQDNGKTGEEKTVSCDGVFEYIGLTPTTECFKDLGVLNQMGYVEVNDRMVSKVPGIFGAGDCVTKNLRQVITACADGAIAAQEASHYVKNL